MTFALVRISPLAIVQRFYAPPAKVSVPGLGDIHGVQIGWEGAGHRLVDVVEVGDPPHRLALRADETPVALTGHTLTVEVAFDDLGVDKMKTALCADIDREAEARRAAVITAGAGQAMEYAAVMAEATAFLQLDEAAQKSADADDWPMLGASLGIDGRTLADVAHAVAANNAADQGTLAGIRRTRLAAKAAIREATTAAQAVAVSDRVEWPPGC